MCISLMGLYLIRMVRSVETKRMRGTKEKMRTKEKLVFGFCLFTYLLHVVFITLVRDLWTTGWQLLHVTIHVLWWRICIFVCVMSTVFCVVECTVVSVVTPHLLEYTSLSDGLDNRHLKKRNLTVELQWKLRLNFPCLQFFNHHYETRNFSDITWGTLRKWVWSKSSVRTKSLTVSVTLLEWGTLRKWVWSKTWGTLRKWVWSKSSVRTKSLTVSVTLIF